MARYLTSDEEADIINRYQNKEPPTEIARKRNISAATIFNVLRRNGIALNGRTARSGRKPRALTSEQEQLLVNHYTVDKISLAKLALQFDINKSTAAHILKRHGVEASIGRPPSCALNHEAFDTLTPESLYWMGFLTADGTIGDYGGGSSQVILEVAERDREHVEKFRSFLGSTHAITKSIHKKTMLGNYELQDRASASFRVRSNKLADALAQNGVTKISKERAPVDKIADSIDYWRGCIDGDGTVRWSDHDNGKYRYPQILLCGHIPLLDRYKAFLDRKDVRSNIVPTSSGIWQIRLEGKSALKVIKLLYVDAIIVLERKHATALEIINTNDSQ